MEDSGGEENEESGGAQDSGTGDEDAHSGEIAAHAPESAPARNVLDMFRRGVNAPTFLLRQNVLRAYSGS